LSEFDPNNHPNPFGPKYEDPDKRPQETPFGAQYGGGGDNGGFFIPPPAGPAGLLPPRPPVPEGKDFAESGLLRPNDGGSILLVVFGVLALFSIIIGMILPIFPEVTPNSSANDILSYVIINTLPIQLGFIGLYFLFVRGKKLPLFRAVGLGKPQKTKATIFAGLLIPIIIAAAILGTFYLIAGYEKLLQHITNGAYDASRLSPLAYLKIPDMGYLIGYIIFLAVLPAIGEELLFRGILLNALKKWGTVPAVLISSALFAIFHGNPSQIVHQFFLGLILAYIAIRTKCLWLAMLGHFFNNLYALLLEVFREHQNFNPAPQISEWALWVAGILCVVALVVGVSFIIDFLTGNIKNNIFVRLFTRKKDDNDTTYSAEYSEAANIYHLRRFRPNTVEAEKAENKLAKIMLAVAAGVFVFMIILAFAVAVGAFGGLPNGGGGGGNTPLF
jgi:membrane protease YdiL (CAAX protease family)